MIEEYTFTPSYTPLREIVLNGKVARHEETIGYYCGHCGLVYKFLSSSCEDMPCGEAVREKKTKKVSEALNKLNKEFKERPIRSRGKN